jgi:hypothetical protein
VLFTDIVDSTKRAAEIGDWKWVELLQQHEVIVRREFGAIPWPGDEHNGGWFPGRFRWTRLGHPPWAEHLSAGTLVGHRHRVETLLEMP